MLVNSLTKILFSSIRALSVVGVSMAAMLMWGCFQKLSAAETTQKLDFNFQIRPILADRCFKCHGPDEKARLIAVNKKTGETAWEAQPPKVEVSVMPREGAGGGGGGGGGRAGGPGGPGYERAVQHARRDDLAAERRYITSLADAGADWWNEWVPPKTPVARVRELIAAGPCENEGMDHSNHAHP